MPDGFTDRAAWDAIHWKFGTGSVLDEAVIAWQLDNQDRVHAASARIPVGDRASSPDGGAWGAKWGAKSPEVPGDVRGGGQR